MALVKAVPPAYGVMSCCLQTKNGADLHIECSIIALFVPQVTHTSRIVMCVRLHGNMEQTAVISTKINNLVSNGQVTHA